MLPESLDMLGHDSKVLVQTNCEWDLEKNLKGQNYDSDKTYKGMTDKICQLHGTKRRRIETPN